MRETIDSADAGFQDGIYPSDGFNDFKMDPRQILKVYDPFVMKYAITKFTNIVKTIAQISARADTPGHVRENRLEHPRP